MKRLIYGIFLLALAPLSVVAGLVAGTLLTLGFATMIVCEAFTGKHLQRPGKGR